MEEDFNTFENFFKGYQLCWVSASKEARYGRARGGSIFAIRLDLISLVFKWWKVLI